MQSTDYQTIKSLPYQVWVCRARNGSTPKPVYFEAGMGHREAWYPTLEALRTSWAEHEADPAFCQGDHVHMIVDRENLAWRAPVNGVWTVWVNGVEVAP